MGRLARARQLAAAMKLHRSRHALEFGPREDLLRFQRERFARTVRHAARRSPLYRELYAGVDLSAEIEPSALPTVSKATLVERFDDWSHRRPRPRRGGDLRARTFRSRWPTRTCCSRDAYRIYAQRRHVGPAGAARVRPRRM